MNNASLELGGDNWAAKDGNLLGYAVGDSSGKYVPNEFTFARGSNLSATRVNADGLIEKGRENLLLQSNNFGTTWQTINASVTSGQSGYDGSSDAWLLTSTGGPLYQSISESGVVTFSVYAKANSGAGFLLRVDQTTQTKLEFNISTGAFISGSNYIDYNSTSIGNGWYRLSVVFLAASTTTAQFRITDGSGTNISGSAYIQDAQLEIGLAATEPIESGASKAKAGILENEPRIDYSSGTASLLLEPQRTNIFQFSEYYNTTWSKPNVTITNNETTSPEGVDNASMLEVDATGQPRIELGGEVSKTYSVSIFVKKNVGDYFGFGWYQGGIGNNYTRFNISTGAWDARAGSAFSDEEVVEYGDGWYRISAKLVTTSNSGKSGVKFVAMSASSFSSGNVGDKFYIYGAQLEEASCPTSYIPTYGTSQTRLEDEAPFPATFRFGTLGDGESGTIVVKTIVNGLSSSNRFNFFSNGGSANWYWNGFNLYSQTTGGSRQFNLGSTASSNLGTEVKLCMRKSGNTLSCFFNGGGKGSIDIGSETIRYFNNFSTYFISQSIVEFEEFPTALTDNECIELTTI